MSNFRRLTIVRFKCFAVCFGSFLVYLAGLWFIIPVPFRVVDGTEPADFQWARIIVVVRVCRFGSADLAWLFFDIPASYPIVDALLSVTFSFVFRVVASMPRHD